MFLISEAGVVHITEGSTLVTVSPNLRSWNIAESSGTWRGGESPTGSETVARYLRGSFFSIIGMLAAPINRLSLIRGNVTAQTT